MRVSLMIFHVLNIFKIHNSPLENDTEANNNNVLEGFDIRHDTERT